MAVNFGGFPATLPGQDAAVRLSLLCCRRLDGEAVIDELIAADQTDWNPSGLSDAQAIFVTQYVGVGYKINSLAGGAIKVTKVIVNDDPDKNLTLTHQHGGSTAANRFNFTSFNGGSDIVLAPSYAAALEYDPASSRWICSAVGIPFPLANDPGVDGALWYTGAGAPSSSPDFGNDNDLYFDTGAFSPDTAGNIWKKISGSWSLIASIRGPAGSPGSPGSDGSDGADPGVLLVWDTGTSDADPGSGKIRADNASLASAAVLYVSKTSKGGSDISAFLASLDDSTNTNKGDLLLTKPSDDSQAGFVVTGITDATGYVKVAVSGPFGATSFSAASPISFQFTRAGNKGIDGLGAGDMLAATYDPNGVADDAFDQDNMVDGATNKNYTATEQTKLAGVETGADVTDAGNVGSSIHGATAKTTLADGDEVTITDSAASYVLKRITWANFYAAIWSILGAVIAGGTGKSTPVDADTLALSDSAATNATKKLTWANLKATIWSSFGALIAGGTSKSTPADGDEVAIADSASSSATKRLSWANIKATLKTYFDTLYQPVDSDLTTIAGLTATTDNFIQAKSSAWASRTPAQVAADLPAVVGDSGSGGTKGLVPAPSAGDAAAGKFLKADGTFAVPSGSSGAKAADQQVFNSSGTWTKPTGFSSKAYVLVECWGGGGGAARGTANFGAGGGGGYKSRWILLSSLGSTETVTVGAGGVGRTGSTGNGTDGGNTTFGSWVTAYGGQGGQSNLFGKGAGLYSVGGNLGSSLSISDALTPECGGDGTYESGSLQGGRSVYGGGGGGAKTNTTGGASQFAGSGASAVSGTPSKPSFAGGGGTSTNTNTNGGDGGDGKCVVTVFDGA